MKDHIKAIVWPREKATGPQGHIYRYAIVGMVVTDTPIEGLEGKNQILLDEGTNGKLFELISGLEKIEHDEPMGDATNVMVSLAEINK